MISFKENMRYKKIMLIFLFLMLLCQGCNVKSSENANEKNLITCTRYLNISGMLSVLPNSKFFHKDVCKF